MDTNPCENRGLWGCLEVVFGGREERKGRGGGRGRRELLRRGFIGHVPTYCSVLYY